MVATATHANPPATVSLAGEPTPTSVVQTYYGGPEDLLPFPGPARDTTYSSTPPPDAI